MLAKLAPWCVLGSFPTTPPHLARPLALVHPARPVKVISILEVFLAICAQLGIDVPLALLLHATYLLFKFGHLFPGLNRRLPNLPQFSIQRINLLLLPGDFPLCILSYFSVLIDVCIVLLFHLEVLIF